MGSLSCSRLSPHPLYYNSELPALPCLRTELGAAARCSCPALGWEAGDVQQPRGCLVLLVGITCQTGAWCRTQRPHKHPLPLQEWLGTAVHGAPAALRSHPPVPRTAPSDFEEMKALGGESCLFALRVRKALATWKRLFD